jgi:hypothetical protein
MHFSALAFLGAKTITQILYLIFWTVYTLSSPSSNANILKQLLLLHEGTLQALKPEYQRD